MTNGICVFCGNESTGEPFTVKSTFTDLDKLQPGQIVCNACAFFLEEQSEKLAHKLNKEKPQRMRNYSHFIVCNEWIPLSKGNKSRMTELLLSDPFPELAAIASSGQKHIVFRATHNPQGASAGWVQFEEQKIWVNPIDLKALLTTIEQLYVTFSKSEIETGNYYPKRILDYGLKQWQEDEQKLKKKRGSALFDLAIFLAQRKELDAGTSSGTLIPDMEGDTGSLQEQIQKNDLGSVHGSNQVSDLHEQHREVYQHSLFEA